MKGKKKQKNNGDIRIVRAGFVSKEEQVQTRIIFVLFDSKNPLSNKEIASQTKLSRNHVSEITKRLVKIGVVIPVSNGNDRTFYTLQPFLVDDKKFRQILTNVESLAKCIGRNVIVNYTEEPFENILKNNTLALMSMLKMSLID